MNIPPFQVFGENLFSYDQIKPVRESGPDHYNCRGNGKYVGTWGKRYRVIGGKRG